MADKTKQKPPLVYSCSGCSDVAQIANEVALRLFREDSAEMSCIAGVGGNVPALVNAATSGRKIIALDGCPMHCVKGCLAQQNIEPELHLTFSDFGFRKRKGAEFDEAEADRAYEIVKEEMVKASIV